MEPLLLDMMIIIVVVAELFFAKVGVLEGMLMSRVTVVAGNKVVELVCSVRVVAEETD
jgi:hypothetical protein